MHDDDDDDDNNTKPRPHHTHEADVDVSPDTHAVGKFSRHPSHQLQEQGLLDVLVPVDLGGNGPRQLGENLRGSVRYRQTLHRKK